MERTSVTSGRRSATLGLIARPLSVPTSLAIARRPAFYLVYPAVLLVALVLPCEAIPPVLSTPWVALTDEKLTLLVLVVAWLLLARRAVPAQAEWRELLPTLVFIFVALVSAKFAAADYANEAVHNVGLLVAAAFMLLVALRIGGDAERTRGLLWAIAIGGGLSALLGIGEALRLPVLGPLLALFKVAPTRVGGELRVIASFQYATIASMYFEMVAPLAIVLAATARRRTSQLLGIAIAVACTVSVVLSLTRAGMLTLAAIYALLILAAAIRKNVKLRVVALGPAAVLLGGVALLLVHDPVFDLRLVSESDADWYGAVYSAPTALTLQANQLATVDIDVRNAGRITWTSTGNRPFALGYRWLTDDGNGVLDVAPAEVPLPHDVAPGETVHLRAQVGVPDLPAGAYRLDWGMLQRDVLEFYERGWADAETQISVASAGAAAPPVSVTPRDDAQAPWVVGRLELWSAAVRMIAQHPLLGLGPDNFRHYYGAELGLEAWDERVQANNLYLEILADLGVLGLAAFVWIVVHAARRIRTNSPLDIALGLALLAFLVHGTLDSFLSFTPTALLFWILLGLLQAQKPQVSGR